MRVTPVSDAQMPSNLQKKFLGGQRKRKRLSPYSAESERLKLLALQSEKSLGDHEKTVDMLV